MRAQNENMSLGSIEFWEGHVCLSTADFYGVKVKLKRTAKACLKGKEVMRTTHDLYSVDKEVMFGDNGKDLKTDFVL